MRPARTPATVAGGRVARRARLTPRGILRPAADCSETFSSRYPPAREHNRPAFEPLFIGVLRGSLCMHGAECCEFPAGGLRSAECVRYSAYEKSLTSTPPRLRPAASAESRVHHTRAHAPGGRHPIEQPAAARPQPDGERRHEDRDGAQDADAAAGARHGAASAQHGDGSLPGAWRGR